MSVCVDSTFPFLNALSSIVETEKVIENMGGNFSILDDDYDDDYGKQKRSTKPVPHRRLSTTKILDALSNTFRHWQEIVVNMRESRLPDDEAQPYLFQEMLTTRDTLNNILVSFHALTRQSSYCNNDIPSFMNS